MSVANNGLIIMGVKLTTPMAQINKTLREEVEKQRRVLVRTMLYCAEEITNAARTTNSYSDRTGNLRSSIGCIVVVDGRILQEYGFEQVKEGAQGVVDGKEFAYSLAKQYPKGVAIIAVAGKEYASYVADKGYDVLDSAEELAKKVIEQSLKDLRIMKKNRLDKEKSSK